MATARNHHENAATVGNNDDLLQLLSQEYADQLDSEIIESVLFACNYELPSARRSIADMLGIALETDAPPDPPQNVNNQLHQLPPSQSDLHLPVVQFARKEYRTVILLRGLPGSGKTTLAKQLLDEIIGPCNPRDFIFCADDFFMRNGMYVYNSFEVKDAHAWIQNRAYAAMQKGISPIIVDNTNTQAWEMKPYVVWAVQNGYHIYIEEANTPWRFKVSDLARRNKHRVPKEKIIDMLDRYDKNVTVERLLREFGVYYGSWEPPVLRNYPPVKNKETSPRGNCANAAMARLSVGKKDAVTNTNDGNSFVREVFSTGSFENYGQLPPKYPRMGYFDKGTITDEVDGRTVELSAQAVKNEAVDALQNIFKSVPRDCLEDILIRCKGDVDWCISLLLEDPKEGLENYQAPERAVEDANEEIEVIEEDADDLLDAAMASCKNSVESRKRLDEQNLELKKYLETNIVINSEHYGPNVSRLKGLDRAEAGPSRSQPDDGFVMLNADLDDDEDDSISENSEPLSAEGQDDDMVELNLGSALVEQLNHLFGDMQDQLPGFYTPVVEVPRKLAEQLHAIYYESVLKQMENQQMVLRQMQAEDEEMQMKLQLEEIRKSEEQEPPSLRQIMKDQAEAQRNQKLAENQWRNLTPPDMAYKMTMQKLVAGFPDVPEETLAEIFQAHALSFDETTAALQDSGAEYVANEMRTISAGTLEEMQVAHDDSKAAQARDRRGFEDREPTSVELRQEAANHLKRRVDLLNKAKQYYGKGMTEVAMFYSELASEQTKMCEKYNSMAAVQIVNEGFHRSNKADTIDLHYLRVAEALNTLDIYIDEVVDRLSTTGKSYKEIFVITGRGKNSVNGIPRIRPSVEQRLKKRKLKYNRVNEGLLKVRIHQTSLVTAQLP